MRNLENRGLIFQSITIAPSLGPTLGRSGQRRRLDLDILVSVHCCRIMPFTDGVPPTRKFSEHRGQWVNQTIKASTLAVYHTHVSLEGQRRCCRPQVANAESLEILNDTHAGITPLLSSRAASSTSYIHA